MRRWKSAAPTTAPRSRVDHSRGGRMNPHPMNLAQRLAVRDSVTHLLEESPTLEAAARGALQTVCESLTWEWGALWVVDPQPFSVPQLAARVRAWLAREAGATTPWTKVS